MLVSTKPTYALLVLLLFALAWLRFDNRSKLIAGTFPLVALVAAGVLSGFDWPLRFIEHVRSTPPRAMNVALAAYIPSLAAVIGLSGLVFVLARLRVSTISLADTMLALTVGFVSAPFVAGYHFVALSVPLAWIAARNRTLGVAIWVASWVACGIYFRVWSGALTVFGVLVCACVTWMWRVERESADSALA